MKARMSGFLVSLAPAYLPSFGRLPLDAEQILLQQSIFSYAELSRPRARSDRYLIDKQNGRVFPPQLASPLPQ